MKKHLIILWTIALMTLIANGALIFDVFKNADGIWWQEGAYGMDTFFAGSLVYAFGVLFISLLAALFFAFFPYRDTLYFARFKFWWPVLTLVINLLYIGIFYWVGSEFVN